MRTTMNKAATAAPLDQTPAQPEGAAVADVAPGSPAGEQQKPEHSAPAPRTLPPVSGGRARGTSLGYATAHLGSASVTGLGAIGSSFGLGGVAVAGGVAAGSAVAAYTARRARRSRRAAAGSGTLARGGRVRRGGRGGGLLGWGGSKGVTGRKAAARRATADARPNGRKGLLNDRKGRGLLRSRAPSLGRRRPAGLLGTSQRTGAGHGPGHKGLLDGKRTSGSSKKGLLGTTSRAGGKGLFGGKGGSTSKKGTSPNGKRWKSRNWKGWPGSDTKKGGGKGKDSKKRGETTRKAAAPQPPQFVEETDSSRPGQQKGKQIPDSRRERGTSTGGGRNMGHVMESADTLVTAIAKADIGSARKLDAVFEDLALTEAKLAEAKRHLAARIAEEFPADNIVIEHVNQSAALQVRLSTGLTELRTVFRRAHAKEWERLEAPRRNEQAWDVTQNQE